MEKVETKSNMNNVEQRSIGCQQVGGGRFHIDVKINYETP